MRDFVFAPRFAESVGFEGLKNAVVFPATVLAEISAMAPVPAVGSYGVWGDYGAGKTTFIAEVVAEGFILSLLSGNVVPSVLYMMTEAEGMMFKRSIAVLLKKYGKYYDYLSKNNVLTKEEAEKLKKAIDEARTQAVGKIRVVPISRVEDLLTNLGVDFDVKGRERDKDRLVTYEYVIVGVKNDFLREYAGGFVIIDSLATLLNSVMSAMHMIPRRRIIIAGVNEVGAQLSGVGGVLFVTGHANPAWKRMKDKVVRDYQNYSLTADSVVGYVTKVMLLLKKYSHDGKILENARVFEVLRTFFAGYRSIAGYFTLVDTIYRLKELSVMIEGRDVRVDDFTGSLLDLVASGVTMDDLLEGRVSIKGKGREVSIRQADLEALRQIFDYYVNRLGD